MVSASGLLRVLVCARIDHQGHKSPRRHSPCGGSWGPCGSWRAPVLLCGISMQCLVQKVLPGLHPHHLPSLSPFLHKVPAPFRLCVFLIPAIVSGHSLEVPGGPLPALAENAGAQGFRSPWPLWANVSPHLRKLPWFSWRVRLRPPLWGPCLAFLGLPCSVPFPHWMLLGALPSNTPVHKARSQEIFHCHSISICCSLESPSRLLLPRLMDSEDGPYWVTPKITQFQLVFLIFQSTPSKPTMFPIAKVEISRESSWGDGLTFIIILNLCSPAAL